MIEKAKQLVEELMKSDNSGHGMDHINRVFLLAMKFAEKEKCDKDIVALGALLHDVDDYKLFGAEHQEKLINTNNILNTLGLSQEKRQKIFDIIKNLGYSKRLKGISPSSIEGKIVSDADMCDASGAMGILRTFQYSLKHGRPFFDRDAWPVEDIDAEKYRNKSVASSNDSAVCHFFEKLLKLKNLMFTDSGKAEAEQRHQTMIAFLRQTFREENAPEWEEYLDNFLKKI